MVKTNILHYYVICKVLKIMSLYINGLFWDTWKKIDYHQKASYRLLDLYEALYFSNNVRSYTISGSLNTNQSLIILSSTLIPLLW